MVSIAQQKAIRVARMNFQGTFQKSRLPEVSQGEFILAEKFCRNNGLGPILDFPARMR